MGRSVRLPHRPGCLALSVSVWRVFAAAWQPVMPLMVVGVRWGLVEVAAVVVEVQPLNEGAAASVVEVAATAVVRCPHNDPYLEGRDQEVKVQDLSAAAVHGACLP